MASVAMADRTVFLSTLAPSVRERRFAGAVVWASFVIFLCLAPFARVKLPVVWAFIPSYEGALVVIDLITTALMFAQVVLLHGDRCWCWPAAICSARYWRFCMR
jgi:two-component system sensor histidine kinase UhpB